MTGQVIDVRQANEYAAGHVPGALNIELGAVDDADLHAGAGDGDVRARRTGHDRRQHPHCSRTRGDVVVLDGGPDTWADSTGNPLQTSP